MCLFFKSKLNLFIAGLIYSAHIMHRKSKECHPYLLVRLFTALDMQLTPEFHNPALALFTLQLLQDKLFEESLNEIMHGRN